MPTNNAGSLADEMERLRSGNESFLPELGKMNSRAAFMDKHFDTILNALRASPSVDQGVVQEDRDAAAAIASGFGCHATAEQIVAGRLDDDPSVQALACHRHRFASPQTAGEVGEDKAGGLWYRRWFKASVELNEALSRVAELERENFTLAAGQCIVERGLLGDEHGHQFCALTAERDAALARCERLEGELENEREECANAADRAIKDFALTTAENKSPGACAAVAYNAIRARAALGEGGGR
jgi:hypothetical protein